MGNSSRPPLTDRDYMAVRNAASTHREALIVRLAGEVGVTTAEIPEVCPSDIQQIKSTPPRHVITVEGREAFLPTGVRRELIRYTNQRDIEDTEPIIDLTPRRVQMIIQEVTDRAAQQTGRRPLEQISGQDLRYYFAYTALVDKQVPLRIVKAVGGWETTGPLTEYTRPVDPEEIVAAFASDNSVNGTTSGIAQTLDNAVETVLTADNPDTLLDAVCAAIADGEGYIGAYVADRSTGINGPRIQAAEGISKRVATQSARQLDERSYTGADGHSPAIVASPTPETADRTGTDTIVFVPIASEETQFGVLALLPTEGRSINRQETYRLGLLGEQIGKRTAGLRRRAMIESDAVVELAFRCHEGTGSLVELSHRLKCPIELQSVVGITDQQLLAYVAVDVEDPNVAVEKINGCAAIEEYRLVERQSQTVLFELTIGTGSPLLPLLHAGGSIVKYDIENGTGELVVRVADGCDVRGLVNTVQGTMAELELIGKRTRRDSDIILNAVNTTVLDTLTERQQAVLQAAFASGYFDWPRGSTAEEIADTMEISSPTFHKHLRQGLGNLLDALLDREEEPPTPRLK